LVQLGGADVEETPWNSCEFHFAVNNGCMTDAASSVTGPCRGAVIRRALESSIYLVATCAKGIAAVLESCEFCTIRGSFSNAEVKAPEVPSGHAVTNGGVGLFMRDCCSNCCLSVNFEVAFMGVRLVGSCRGNVFNSIISNNCDERGAIINDDDCAEMEATASNLLQCIVRREVRQGNGKVQTIGGNPSKVTVNIAKT
jgi:hypothetical protein